MATQIQSSTNLTSADTISTPQEKKKSVRVTELLSHPPVADISTPPEEKKAARASTSFPHPVSGRIKEANKWDRLLLGIPYQPREGSGKKGHSTWRKRKCNQV